MKAPFGSAIFAIKEEADGVPARPGLSFLQQIPATLPHPLLMPSPSALHSLHCNPAESRILNTILPRITRIKESRSESENFIREIREIGGSTLLVAAFPRYALLRPIPGRNKSPKIPRFFPQSVFLPRGNVINSCA
jgi:hypothetical protein